MIEIDIPGFRKLTLEHLVLDYNGTIAFDGDLVPGVAERLTLLSEKIALHVLTADTRGKCREKVAGLPVEVSILEHRPEDAAKFRFVETLGLETVAAVGNGVNDRLMIEAAALGIAVIGGEGAWPKTVMSADLITTGIGDALDLLLNPLRLMASLRC